MGRNLKSRRKFSVTGTQVHGTCKKDMTRSLVEA